MKRRLVLGLWVMLPAMLLGMSGGHFAQNVASPSANSESARRSLAVHLLRAINTAELDYKLKHGTYAAWSTLVANKDFTDKGTKWAPQEDDRLVHLQFSKDAEILPGWSLRLNLVADGKGYDLLLEDLTDDKCGYAAVTDERGVIRQAKAIDCDF